MINSIYSSTILTKNNKTIPVLRNGRTIESKYDPDKEAESIISLIDKKYNFFVIIGVGSGILVQHLLNKYDCKIMCLETTMEDYNFLSKLDSIRQLQKNPNVIFTDIYNIDAKLINNYIPSLHGDIKIIEQKQWINENIKYLSLIKEKISNALNVISIDYSTQCYFGKIWQSNIMNNLHNLNNKEFNLSVKNYEEAIVVAAGPTLDQSIMSIKKQSNQNLFIISTDTAYPILSKNNIEPQIVITLDGQNISYNHYLGLKKDCNTLFVLDLCSSYTISRYLLQKGVPFIYFISGHPLSQLINKFSNNQFFTLYSGMGTVTITALDLALKLGFNKIKILGADFAFKYNKSYAKGTYFDILNRLNNNKNNTEENKFNNLMFRVPLFYNEENDKTTTILNNYRQSLEFFLSENGCSYIKNNSEYYITNNKLTNNKVVLHSQTFDNNKIIEKIKNMSLEELEYPLLPYVSWLRKNIKFDDLDINKLLKLAQSHIVRYN